LWIDPLKIFLHRIIEAKFDKYMLVIVSESLIPMLPFLLESSNYPIQVIAAVKLEAVLPIINHSQVASGELMGH
jgi:hypothetical protein